MTNVLRHGDTLYAGKGSQTNHQPTHQPVFGSIHLKRHHHQIISRYQRVNEILYDVTGTQMEDQSTISPHHPLTCHVLW
jgi:hypothetical protein